MGRYAIGLNDERRLTVCDGSGKHSHDNKKCRRNDDECGISNDYPRRNYSKYVKALSVSIMNSVSCFVTIFAQPSIYFRTLSVSMMNSVSRLAVLTTGNRQILS